MGGVQTRKIDPRLHAIPDGKELRRVSKCSVPLLQQLRLHHPKDIRRQFDIRTLAPRQKQTKTNPSLSQKPTFLPLRTQIRHLRCCDYYVSGVPMLKTSEVRLLSLGVQME